MPNSMVEEIEEPAGLARKETNSVTTQEKNRFFKVNIDGQILPDDSAVWHCVYDSSTGLMWEVKRDDGGWQDWEHTYSWYEPSTESATTDEPEDGPEALKAGASDRGECYGTPCDTQGFVTEVNLADFCGSTAWRLPDAGELRLLDHPVNYYPDIDTRYFPNTMSARYWSRTEVPANPSLAWSVDFNNGFPYIAEKRMIFHVRLVTEAPWLQADPQVQP